MQPNASMLAGRWVLVCFLAFFGVIFVVDGAMVSVALRSYTGLVTDHPYEKGLAYNQVVDEANAQAALGWKPAMVFDAADDRTATLAFELHDASGALLTPTSLKLEVQRPTQQNMDFSVELKPGKNTLSFPASGLWELRVYATVGDTPYQYAKRVVIP